MNSTEIEAFLAIVRHDSLTNAADSLYISQSTLSHRLAKLEHKLDINLIERGRGIRSLKLTNEGQEFLNLAKRWEDILIESKQLRSKRKKLSLSIGAVDSINKFVLPPVYQALSKYQNEIEISIRTQQSSELYLLLERGEIDIAFGLIEQPMPSMIIHEFLSEPLVVIRREDSDAESEMINFSDLDSNKELYMNWHSSFHSWYNRVRVNDEYSPIRVDTANLLRTFMSTPGYWAIVPLSMAKNFEQTGKYNLYFLKDSPPDRICYKISKKDPRPNAVESLNILDKILEKHSHLLL